MKVRVFIERGKDGSYGAYMPDDNGLDYGVIGDGATAAEAIADFRQAYEEMRLFYLAEGRPFTEVEFEFSYDPQITNDMTDSIKEWKDSILSKIQTMEREDLLRIINGTYIAERFFGKPGSWLAQKLDDNDPSEFTTEERNTLADALDVISIELQELSDELR